MSFNPYSVGECTAAPKRKVGRPRKNADAAEQKEVESVKTATPATPKVTEDKVVTEKAPEVIEKAVPAQAPEKKTKANKPAEEKKVVVKPQPQKKAEPVIDEESNILSGADDDDFIFALIRRIDEFHFLAIFIPLLCQWACWTFSIKNHG